MGLIFSYGAILWILVRWGRLRLEGPNPVPTYTFVAILFTSGLDVGLIMFPLTEFATYADHTSHPEYAFTNPLAIEFGFWGFMVWAIYFLTCFYFCALEPKIRFFEKPLVKWCNNIIIIGTCAFTGYLLLSNLPWYMPWLGDGRSVVPAFYGIVFTAIAAAVYSSTDIRYVKILSLSTSGLFLALIAAMWLYGFTGQGYGLGDYGVLLGLVGGYFAHIDGFLLPINDYHEFYLFWWFAWSIMIGQFTARFVGGLTTFQMLAAMVLVPSIPIALWFAVLYHYHGAGIDTSGMVNAAMIIVGITFVINSLDSLVRLYTDNLNLTVERLGRPAYLAGNFLLLGALVMLFQLDFLKIQWVGALVIALYFLCALYGAARWAQQYRARGQRT
jgi:choline-glycine betaine transporter